MKKHEASKYNRSTRALSSLTGVLESFSVPVTAEPIDNKPSPLDFDAFIPWVSLQLENPQSVVVKRIQQEEYKGRLSKKIKSAKIVRVKHSQQESVGTSMKSSFVIDRPSATYVHSIENALIVIACYDTRGRLVEISINGSRSKINRKLIQAFKLCLPFHPLLTKLNICKGGLNTIVLHEINKMLPLSNLTDICFDDSFVPEGNYYILLEQTSFLLHLSLKRCKINNLICKELAARLDYGRPASKTLVMLDLGSNSITDDGAQAFGDIFRRNRRLLYINLSGNSITDSGVNALVKHLQEFPLTADEIMEIRRKKIEYLEKKEAYNKMCLENILSHQEAEDILTLSSVKRMSVSAKSKSGLKKKNDLSDTERAKNITNATFGDFEDIFDTQNVVIRDDHTYCIGNLILCYINLSYTELELPSVVKILDILRYQNTLVKVPPATGLLNVVIEGNYIANASTELCDIDEYLRIAVTNRLPERNVPRATTPRSYSKKGTSLVSESRSRD